VICGNAIAHSAFRSFVGNFVGNFVDAIYVFEKAVKLGKVFDEAKFPTK